jgi:hypothetical protein
LSLRVLSDYEDKRDVMRTAVTPILISHRQHYQLLGDLVACVLARMPALRYVLIETPRSYLNELPNVLLDQRVMLIDVAEPIVQWLIERGIDETIQIRFDPRRCPVDGGTNVLRLQLSSQTYAALDIRSVLAACRICDALEMVELRDDEGGSV